MSETKQQPIQWVGVGKVCQRKRKRLVPFAGKVMATIFWNSCGVVLTDYLEKDKTITWIYYASLLNKMKDAIQAKRPHLAKKVLFHHDNAPAHTSRVVAALRSASIRTVFAGFAS